MGVGVWVGAAVLVLVGVEPDEGVFVARGVMVAVAGLVGLPVGMGVAVTGVAAGVVVATWPASVDSGVIEAAGVPGEGVSDGVGLD
jgi:hypothetical protein